MKSLKYTTYFALFLIQLTFTNCTAWPAIAALLGLAGGGGGDSPLLLLPPGGDSGSSTPLTSNLILTTTTTSGYYRAGTVIDITVQFPESVDVTGVPKLRLNNTVDVSYFSGSGSDRLVFRYTVQSGNGEDIVGLETANQSALRLDGGTIKSTATTNDMVIVLPVPGSTNSFGHGKVIVIDTIAPTVVNVTSSSPNATYGIGANISIEIEFSEVVNVVGGPPQIILETGAVDRSVNCSSGSGTTTLICEYIVQSGDVSNDLDYVDINSFLLNGGTIQDGALNNANLTLATAGSSTSLGSNKAIVINTISPSVTNVTSSLANGIYTVGQVIPIEITFSEPVNVTGTPQLELETGATNAIINYTSGSGTATLVFNYVVALGHTSLDLDYLSNNALILNGGSIRDLGNLNDAILTLAVPGLINSLGFNKGIVVDTVSPVVTSVNSPTSNGTYKAGDVISIEVNFSEAVVVTGTPQLTLETGAADAIVNFTGGSGTSTLTFAYTVLAGHNASDLDYLTTTSLVLNGGNIQDLAGNGGILTLATPGDANSLGANKAIVIDTTSPTVTNVSSPTVNGTYKVGDVVLIEVNFSEAVTVSGTPQLTLETGGSDAVVNYTGGSGTSTLSFSYTVASGHSTNDLDYQSTSALALAGGTIRDTAGNDATLTLFSPGTAGSLGANEAIVIDGVFPTITSITSSTANGTYKVGDVISIQVNFSEPVNVTNTPQLTLETGTTDAIVNYTSGNTTSELTFNYTVAAGHSTNDLDYHSISALALNGGTIRDVAGNDAILTLFTPGTANSLGANKAITIDGILPTVTSVTSSTANGTYKSGDVVSVQVEFSKPVTVTGTPQLTLETGATDAIVSYTSGSTTSTLTFEYTVATGHTSGDLDYQSTSALLLAGGTIRDTAGNNANLTLAAPGDTNSLGANKAIVIDTTSPTVTNVTSSNTDGTYKVGDVILVEVNFSEAVTVSGTPQLTLETGGSDAVINYTTGSGTTTLSFSYTVVSGHTTNDLDYQSTSALALAGGTIRDTAGNDATLTLFSPGTANSLGGNKAIVIDGIIPTVTNVTSSTANGMYGIGQTISIQVEFSKPVTVTGSPEITLETGTTDAVVSYSSGSTTSILTFIYTIASGHISSDLDYISTSSLALNGGTIRDTAGNNANLTLASPGDTNSLGSNKAIVINTVTPTVSFQSATSTNDESTTTVNIPVQLSAVSALAVTVDYALGVGSTATGGGVDYTLTSGTLSFAQGETIKDITFTVNNDSLNEGNETVVLVLSTPTNSNLGTHTTHTYTIQDNDPLPTVQFAIGTSSSGNESSTIRNIEVTLSAVSGQTVTVLVTDNGGTATSGVDYTSIGSPITVTFNPGVTSQNVQIPILQDLDFEGDETIQLTLSAPTNATISGITAHTFTITDDDVGILSAETMDADNDGMIDHYKLTFSESIQDSSFPGYILNSIGSAQTDWLVGGYSGVVLAHGTSAPEADTANDEVIYLRFTESGLSDTDAKPNLTTTASPGLTAVSAKTVEQIFTATVVEVDRAKPVLLSAIAQVATTLITLTFSEPVWTADNMPACGAGGDLQVIDFIYNDVSGSSSSGLSTMGSDTCGTDMVVTVNTNIALMPSDNVDTLVATTGIFDSANNNGNPAPRIIVATGGPMITSAELFDTNRNGKIDQIKITFSISMQDSTFGDSDASRFTFGGTSLTKVNSSSGGTGVIVSPNNDPGASNDSIVTVFTDDFTVSGTDIKTLSFTQNSGRWQGNSTDLQTIVGITVTDKAPPVILTAVANENANPVLGIDSDDTLVLTFSEATNKPTIDNGNISTILSTTPAHNWGTITSTSWNLAGDVLTIHFAGSGSDISVGDYVNILGTIADSAGNVSTNIPSANPISGNFNVTYPRVSSASSVSSTIVRVTYSEPVNETHATNTANYKIANSASVTGVCTDNSNFASASVLTISAISKVDDYTYDLTTTSQTSGTSYALLVNKPGVSHKNFAGFTLECPNNANFTGQEVIRIASVSCNTLTQVVVTFSKNVKTGVNVAGSAECNSKSECDKRYSIKGTVTGVEIGDLQSAYVLDGTVCGGLPANPSRVCLTHSLLQAGSIYTLVSANNTNGDGFDDTSFGAIKNSTDTESLQLSPKDRGSFAGCGTVPHNFVEGPIISDPFGDGTAFGYLNRYGNKVYIGPNKNGNGATRFNADGSVPENLTFELTKDSTGSRVSASTATAPFKSIGYTGCTANNSGLNGCGPNNENGRGLFAVGTFSGTEYLFLGGAAASNNDYLYYTQDLDSILNFGYMDSNQVFHNYDTGTCPASNSSSVTQNQVSESIHVFNGAIYWSMPGDGTNRPFSVKVNALKGEINCNTGDGDYFNMRYMTGVGRLAENSTSESPSQIDPITNVAMQAQPDILGGIFHSFNDRVYFANSGSISYQKNANSALRCVEGDTYKAGVCEQTGGIVRSINNNPGKCTRASNVNTCSDWVNITPSSLDFRKYFSIGLEDNKDLINAQRPIPAFEAFGGNYYFIRNACTKVLWDDGTVDGGDSGNGCGFSSSCGTTSRNDNLCADADRVPQLWKCTPGGDGHCDAGDWSLVAQNGTTGKTNFGDINNRKITLLAKNGTYLYVGFDNNTTGIEIWRTNLSNPSTEGDFSQIGGDGFGSGTDITEIYSNIALKNGSINYLYLSIGKNSVPVRVHRQQNEADVVFGPQVFNTLLAFLNQGNNSNYAILLILLIVSIVTYLRFRYITRGKNI